MTVLYLGQRMFVVTIPKHVLRNFFTFFPFGRQEYLDDILKYSPQLSDFYDNVDLLLKLSVAGESQRNHFLQNESCTQLIIPTAIDSIRYQNSFRDLRLSCKVLESILDCNSAYLALWILAVLKKRDVFWVKEITKINVEGMELFELPKNFHQLSHLEEINLRRNDFGTTHLDFSHFSRLKTLLIDENNLESFPNLTGCLLLENLDVSNNALQKCPKSIGNHRLLRKLNISFNRITNIPNSIGNLVTLEEFIFCSNRIRHLPDDLVKCRSLEHICGFKNFIHQLPPHMDKLQYLSVLEMDDNEIEVFPNELCSLSHLVKIDFSQNFIQTLPEDIGNLSKLACLNVACNHILYIPPSITKLKNMHRCFLSENPFLDILRTLLQKQKISQQKISKQKISQQKKLLEMKEMYVEMIRHLVVFFHHNSNADRSFLQFQHDLKEEPFFIQNILPELRTLSVAQHMDISFLQLSNCKMNHVPQALQICAHVKKLDLSINEIVHIDDGIYGCHQLQELDISTNQITKFALDGLQFPHLKKLDLSNNKLKTFCFQHDGIEELNLINNKLRKWPKDLILHCPKLQKLHCANNHLSNFFMPTHNLANLTTICLQNNRISDISWIAQCKNVEHLDLENNHISHLPKEILLLPKLRYLNIKGNRLTKLPNIQSPALQYLFVQNNDIQQIPMMLLQSPHLKQVSLQQHLHSKSKLQIRYR